MPRMKVLYLVKGVRYFEPKHSDLALFCLCFHIPGSACTMQSLWLPGHNQLTGRLTLDCKSDALTAMKAQDSWANEAAFCLS